MSKLTWKGGTILAPVPPALVSCGTVDKPNVLTVAWTGIINSNPPMTYVSVRPERYSHRLIAESGEFVINLTPSKLVRTADFCGVKSGAQLDKFAACHLTAEQSSQLAAPMIAECPVSLECRVQKVVPLGSHDMFVAQIVAVNVDEAFVDEQGRLRLEQCGLAVYAHGEYFAMGKKIGQFGFSVKKKRTIRKKSEKVRRPKSLGARI